MRRKNGTYGEEYNENEQNYRGGPITKGFEQENEARPKIFNPNMINGENIDASLKLGLQVGKQVLQNSKFVDYFSLQFLKPYFEVSNRYVTKKMKYILFPFLYKVTLFFILKSIDSLSDHPIDETSSEIHREKIEYPDLYLPLMSFITYVLLIAFNSGQSANFNPEIFGKTSTKDFAILVLYTLVLKSVFYIFCNVSVPLLDLLSYVSYKFVLLIFNVLIWILFKNTTVYYAFLAYTFFISMIFMHHILNYRINKENEIRIHQKLIIYIVSSLEILTIFLIMLDLQ